MDVSNFESTPYQASAGAPIDFADAAAERPQFPDFSLKQLIARLILARGAVVRTTNPVLADEYLKFASVFESNKPGIAQGLCAWAKA